MNTSLKERGVVLLAPRSAVLGHDPCGGGERVLWNDANVLRAAGIPVRIYCRDAAAETPATRVSRPYRHLRISASEYCIRVLRKEREALVIGYNGPLAGAIAPHRTIVRFDWDPLLPRFWKLPGLHSRFCRTHYLFPSENTRGAFLENHPGIPSATCEVIPNSVDLEAFKPAPRRSNGALRVGFAGQWVPQKGVGTLLEAWKTVKTMSPTSELWLAGGPRLWKLSNFPQGAREASSEIEKMEREGRLRIAGECRHADMPAFWNSVDVAVVPSQQETFSLAALEAMACGVPVVASKVGGLKELILDGQSGILVEPEDSRSLAEALAKLLADSDLRSSMADGARRRAVAFSVERRSYQLISFLEMVGREDGFAARPRVEMAV